MGTKELRVEQVECIKGTKVAVGRAGKRRHGEGTGCLKKAKPRVVDTKEV